MSSLSSKMIASFAAKYAHADNLSAEESQKVSEIISDKVPFSFEQIALLSSTSNPDIYDAVTNKAAQRYQDAETTLYEAVAEGVESEADLRGWLGMDDSARVQEVIDKMHIYQTIGVPGDPKNACLAS